jgi:hypothetical protein
MKPTPVAPLPERTLFPTGAPLEPAGVTAAYTPVGEDLEPKHTGRGRWYMRLNRIGGVLSLIGAVSWALKATPSGAGGDLRTSVTMAVSGIALLYIAREVRRFTRAGWWGAMVHNAVGIAGLVFVIPRLVFTDASTPDMPPGLHTGLVMMALSATLAWLIPSIVWLRYFWRRREDFV